MRPTTKRRLGRCILGIGMSVALVPTADVPVSYAGEKGQFSAPWSFTARDRRVAIAVAIKQVEDGLLGPSEGDQTATNNNSTDGNVNQQSSGVDSVASALNGNF